MDSQGLRDCLLSLARNHRWTWLHRVRATFEELPGFTRDRHPVQVVAALGDDQLEALLADSELMGRLGDQLADLEAATADPAVPEIAYFSPEFGISHLVPQYSGGLGILAGDHLKATSDLEMALCGVGLFYREGFFRQSVIRGRQSESYEKCEPADLGYVDTGVVVSVPMPGRNVAARVWRIDVGRTPLLALDTVVDSNRPEDRAITDRLYSGDRRHRLEQELVLGVGGSRALTALGWPTPVCHLNEGHAGFLILDLIDHRMKAGADFEAAVEGIGPGLVFTTHTPVAAGIDRFEPALAGAYLAPWADRWNLPIESLLALGGAPNDRPQVFNMAAFCLRTSGRCAGVSKLHGQVSRRLFDGIPGSQTIGSVTNGVHARTWVVPRLQVALDESLGSGWDNGDPEAWARVDEIDDVTIRSLRRAGGTDLRTLVAERTGTTIDPDALIVGFARRFATYKRATLLMRHPERLAALLADDDHPVQFVFAGKAHPADDPGKSLLADVVEYAASPEARGRFVFVADYDMAVARAMYAGCDVWLNTPVRPFEASGTSGEKSALNGGLNCSISDGWWDEMADGRNGWTIPATGSDDATVRDRAESAAVLDLFRDQIVPEYFADGAAWSAAWTDRIRHSWRSLGPRVTASRMVRDYGTTLYGPALDEVRGR